MTHTHVPGLCMCLSNNTCRLSLSLSPGIPLVCFLVLLPLNIPWSQISVTWLGVVHFLACLSPQLGSVVYHLFMNHEGGEPVYHTLLKLDVCGICMINTLGKTPLRPQQVSSAVIVLHPVSAAPLLLGAHFLFFQINNDSPCKCLVWRCKSIDLPQQMCLLRGLADAPNDPSSKILICD